MDGCEAQTDAPAMASRHAPGPRAGQKRASPGPLQSADFLKRQRVLKPYQESMFRRILMHTKPRFIVSLATGLGKTMVALAVASKLTNRCAGRMLILVPSSGKLMRQWHDAAIDWLDMSGSRIDLPVFCIDEPVYKSDFVASPHAKVVIMSHARVLREHKRVLKDPDALSKLFDSQFDVIVIDEIHNGRKINGAFNHALTDLVKKIDCPAIGLTATPVCNYPSDIAAIFKVLDMPEIPCGEDMVDLKDKRDWVDGSGLAETTVSLAQPYMVSAPKRDVVHLPPLIMRDVPFDPKLSRRAAVFYNETLDKALGELDADEHSKDERKNVLNAVMKLRFLLMCEKLVNIPSLRCGFRGSPPGPYIRRANAVEWAETNSNGLLEMLFKRVRRALIAMRKSDPSNRRVIIASDFVAPLLVARRHLERKQSDSKTLKSCTFFDFNGEMDNEDRDAAIDTFLKTQDAVLFLSIKAGGVGLNITPCSRMIFFGAMPWSPATLDQCVARIRRIGCTDKVPFVVEKLRAKGSADDAILKMHEGKQHLIDAVMHDDMDSAELYSEWKKCVAVIRDCAHVSVETGNFINV